MAEHLEALDRITRSGQAAFAIDRTDRIIYWNSRCEAILGHRAEDVLGRRCFEVMCGRDVHGNVHCYANCPVMHQSRVMPSEPIREFILSVRAPGGEVRQVNVASILIPADRASLGAIVHVIREAQPAMSALERQLSHEPARAGASTGMITNHAKIAELTRREREILQCIAKGMPTAGIADTLCISPITVRNHVQNILEKLDVHTKFAAVAFAYQNGLVS